jgi:hypothetical protein
LERSSSTETPRAEAREVRRESLGSRLPGELGGGPADAFSQVGEGHTSRAPQMTEPLTKGDEI